MQTSPAISNLTPVVENQPTLKMGGYAAIAESAWMGSVQSTEVLEPLAAISTPGQPRGFALRLPHIQLAGLFTHEFSIAEASFLLMASFFLSAALGALRQILFNAQFGTGNDANAYYAAFRLPDTLFSLIAGGALSSAMIPVLLSTVRDQGKQAGVRLSRLVLATLLAVMALVVLAGEVFTPFFVSSILAPGFSGATLQLTIELTRIMLFQPLVLIFGSVATAVLNSRNQFFLTALSVLSHNLTLIAGILLARLIPGLGILGPTIGVVAGALLQGVILLCGLTGHENLFHLAWSPTDARLREVIRLLIPNGLAVGVSYAGFIVDTAFASKAVEQASLAAIYNAWLLVGLPIALLGQAIGQAAFPRLAAQVSGGDWRTMRQTLLRSLGAAVSLAIPALLALLLLGRPVIHILFEHGKFDAQAGSVTFSVLSIYAVGLPAFIASELLSRGLIALRNTRTPLITNSIQLALRALLIALLMPGLDVRAIPTAMVIAASLEALSLGGLLFGRLQHLIAAQAASLASGASSD